MSAGVILLVLFGLNLWFWPNGSATSFGVGRNGYKACYQLLSELGMPVRRSYLPPTRIPPRRTLWLMLPSFLEPNSSDGREEASELLRWVRAGGTAVVFGGPGSDWKRLKIKRSVVSVSGKAEISGDFAPVACRLKLPRGLLRFAPGSDHARAGLSVDGAAFALELKLGAGRLVAIADGRFVRNANLGAADASVLAVDLVRALGTPVFDEYCHGLAAPVSIVMAVVFSRAMLPLVVALAGALLWVGEQRSWPRRTASDEPEGPEPSIASFIESLGILYSRAGDPGAVFRAYRTGFLRRLRRLSAGGALAEEAVLERIANEESVPAEVRRWFAEDAVPMSRDELIVAVRAIESYSGIKS